MDGRWRIGDTNISFVKICEKMGKLDLEMKRRRRHFWSCYKYVCILADWTVRKEIAENFEMKICRMWERRSPSLHCFNGVLTPDVIPGHWFNDILTLDVIPGSELWDHKLRQFPPQHVDSFPGVWKYFWQHFRHQHWNCKSEKCDVLVCNIGGLDWDLVLGEFRFQVQPHPQHLLF